MRVVNKTRWGPVVSYLQLIACRIRCYFWPHNPVPARPEARHSDVSDVCWMLLLSPGAGTELELLSVASAHMVCSEGSDYWNLRLLKWISKINNYFLTLSGFCSCEKEELVPRECMFVEHWGSWVVSTVWKSLKIETVCRASSYNEKSRQLRAAACLQSTIHAQCEDSGWKKHHTWSCIKAESTSVCTRRAHVPAILAFLSARS